MIPVLAGIWRHPLKAIGREEMEAADLAPGQWLPGDRLWAVTHARSETVAGWVHKRNFLRGVTAPALMAATARLHEGRLILDHPEAGRCDIDPDDPADLPRFLDWVGPLWPADQPAPVAIVEADDAHLTDVPDPWISVVNLASHRAVEGRAGERLSAHRWRGNLWIDGWAPWEEFDLPGRHLAIGRDCVIRVTERITRCKATMANPETGRRDVDTLAALRSWDHQDFGVYAEIVRAGRIVPGDEVRRAD